MSKIRIFHFGEQSLDFHQNQ